MLQLFDPFDFSLKAVADIDGETWILGVENIPFGASFESVGVGFDKVFESIDPCVEFTYFGHVVVFPFVMILGLVGPLFFYFPRALFPY